MDALFDIGSKKTTEEKLKLLAASTMRTIGSGVTFIVILDGSGSMAGTPWKDLTNAYNDFVAEVRLKRGAAGATQTRIVTIVFHTTATSRTNSLDSVPALGPCPSGGTNFSAAFTQCATDVKATPPDHNVHVIFMTDGAPTDPQAFQPVVRKMLQDSAPRIKKYDCIAFGGGVSLPQLQFIHHEFTTFQVPVGSIMQADDRTALCAAFTTCAGDAAVYRGKK